MCRLGRSPRLSTTLVLCGVLVPQAITRRNEQPTSYQVTEALHASVVTHVSLDDPTVVIRPDQRRDTAFLYARRVTVVMGTLPAPDSVVVVVGERPAPAFTAVAGPRVERSGGTVRIEKRVDCHAAPSRELATELLRQDCTFVTTALARPTALRVLATGDTTTWSVANGPIVLPRLLCALGVRSLHLVRGLDSAGVMRFDLSSTDALAPSQPPTAPASSLQPSGRVVVSGTLTLEPDGTLNIAVASSTTASGRLADGKTTVRVTATITARYAEQVAQPAA
jgi:hypothetical protein